MEIFLPLDYRGKPKKRGGHYDFLPYFEEKRELISPYLDHRFLHVASVCIYI